MSRSSRVVRWALRVGVAGGTLTLALAGSARADEATPWDRPAEPTTTRAPAPESGTTTRWYGHQILVADGAVAATYLGLLLADPTGGTSMLATAVAYPLAASAVHLGHGRVGMALADAGMRIALPVAMGLTGVAIGYATTDAPPATEPLARFVYDVDVILVGGLLGTLGGMVAATTIDAALLAKERVPAVASPSATVAVVPTKGGASVGVAGTF